MSNKANDLLRRATEVFDCVEYGCVEDESAGNDLLNEIRTYLTAEEGKQEEEPVYLFRRKGLNDFVTCSKERFDELSELSLFETKIIHPSPQAEQVKREPMTIDERLNAWSEATKYGHRDSQTFIAGVRFAEKHHGIGGDA